MKLVRRAVRDALPRKNCRSGTASPKAALLLRAAKVYMPVEQPARLLLMENLRSTWEEQIAVPQQQQTPRKRRRRIEPAHVCHHGWEPGSWSILAGVQQLSLAGMALRVRGPYALLHLSALGEQCQPAAADAQPRHGRTSLSVSLDKRVVGIIERRAASQTKMHVLGCDQQPQLPGAPACLCAVKQGP